MPSEDVIEHILNDLQSDITEIKNTVKNTCKEVEELKNRQIQYDAVKQAEAKKKETNLKIVSIVIPATISTIGLILGKITGFLK